MVRLADFLFAAVATLVVGPATAHPGEQHDLLQVKREIETRNAMAVRAKRSLGSCAGSLKHRQLMERAISRRAEAARRLREKRGITSSAFAPNPLLKLGGSSH